MEIATPQSHPAQWFHLHEVAMLIGRETIRAETAKGHNVTMVEVRIPYLCWLTWHRHHLLGGSTPYVSGGHHLGEVQAALAEAAAIELSTPPLVRFHDSP